MRISRFELARKPVPCFLPGECLRDAFPVPVELIPAPVAVVVAMPLSLTPCLTAASLAARVLSSCQIGVAFHRSSFGASVFAMHAKKTLGRFSRHPHRTRFCGKTVPQLRSCHITTSWSAMLKS